MPIKYRILAKTILFLCGFRFYREIYGKYNFWFISNKKYVEKINKVDEIIVNKYAKKGQVKKAKLVCSGEQPRIKCVWEYEIQE